MLTLAAHGNLDLKQISSRMTPQARAVVLKATSGSIWEVVIPAGDSYGFNVQTWGETMRTLFQPIMAISDVNFMEIINDAECYVKESVKGKGKSTDTGASDDAMDNGPDLFEFR